MTSEIRERLQGLYQVYYEVKHHYPDKHKLREIDWDTNLKSVEQDVVQSSSTYEYYIALMRYISLIDDGHTAIIPPWGINPPGWSKPALELQFIGQKLVISRAGNVHELRQQNVTVGRVITRIDDIPVRDAMASINNIYARGSQQSNEAINTYFLLLGNEQEKVRITFEDTNETVSITRSLVQDDGSYYVDRFIDFKNPYDIKMLDNNIVYCKVVSFSTMDIADAVITAIQSNDVNGVIFDLRLTLGGNDMISSKIISHIIQKPIKSPIWRCNFYNQAFDLWGMEMPFKDIQNDIQPSSDNTYMKNIIVLTSGMTSSTAEDMAITLHHAQCATIIGSTTAGSSGNPKRFTLPFGGTLKVSSFTPLTPSKKPYLGIGIEPDIACLDTVESLRNHQDIVLDTALELLQQMK